jgi:arylsulfatase A-like enzyme
MYEDVEIPLPALGDPAIFDALPPFLQESLARDRWHWCCDDPEKYRNNVRGYYRMISGIDAAIGRVLDALARTGASDNTVVIFTSDNGQLLGDRGLSDKWNHFEQSIRVPMIVADLRQPQAGRVESAFALNVDLAPTLLDIASVPAPGRYEGASLMPWLDGAGPADWRVDFLGEHLWVNPHIPRWEGVRTQRFAYARYIDQQPPFEFLHDLDADRDELKNLATSSDHAGVLADLSSRCDELCAAYENRSA